LNTDASFRFERGIDPLYTDYVLKHAALLVQELAGGTVSSEIKDVYPVPFSKFNVDITYKKINTLIGKDIPVETVKVSLEVWKWKSQMKQLKACLLLFLHIV